MFEHLLSVSILPNDAVAATATPETTGTPNILFIKAKCRDAFKCFHDCALDSLYHFFNNSSWVTVQELVTSRINAFSIILFNYFK